MRTFVTACGNGDGEITCATHHAPLYFCNILQVRRLRQAAVAGHKRAPNTSAAETNVQQHEALRACQPPLTNAAPQDETIGMMDFVEKDLSQKAKKKMSTNERCLTPLTPPSWCMLLHLRLACGAVSWPMHNSVACRHLWLMRINPVGPKDINTGGKGQGQAAFHDKKIHRFVAFSAN